MHTFAAGKSKTLFNKVKNSSVLGVWRGVWRLVVGGGRMRATARTATYCRILDFAGPANHPLLEHLNLPDLGSVFTDVSAEGGILITKGLVISHLPQKDEVNEDADG